jgi:hypothetical protein
MRGSGYQYGFLAKHPTTVNAFKVLCGDGPKRHEPDNRLWMEIFISSRKTALASTAVNPQDDVMERS